RRSVCDPSVFLFSSRRRHTRSKRDWSSDVCSSDLLCGSGLQAIISAAQMIEAGDSKLALAGGAESMSQGAYILPKVRSGLRMGRSEERRVGKGGRCGWLGEERRASGEEKIDYRACR